MNGVKYKFQSEDVMDTINTCDILVISETHFNIRTRCPDGFFLAGRSKPSGDKRPRGGVAVFTNMNAQLKINILSDEFVDILVFEIENTNIGVIAPYIPPNNSLYFDEECIKSVQMLWEIYSANRTMYLVGDLNARIGDFSALSTSLEYKVNPDNGSNQNGRKIKDMILQLDNMFVVNGLKDQERIFESKCTFYRGNTKSQIDMALTNNTDSLFNFLILNKLPQSDHCPCMISFKAKFQYPLHFIQNCASGFLCYEHYDVNKRIIKSIQPKKCNLTYLTSQLREVGSSLISKYENCSNSHTMINEMTNDITQGIYISTRNSRTTNQVTSPHPHHKNCSSANYKAIAEANLIRYENVRNTNVISAEHYWDEWIRYHNLATSLEDQELRQSNTKRWKHLLAKDPRKLWKQLDWKGHPQTRPDEIPPETITQFFRNIFQSPTLTDKPTISQISDEIINYEITSDITDGDIEMEEVEYAIKKLGTGSSFDGIAPGVIPLLPVEMRECILMLYRKVFAVCYPDHWKSQLLIPYPKKGHTLLNPKLRGIGIGPVLSRLYDIIVDKRFLNWYQPNPEQAGGRTEQGCVLHILYCILPNFAACKGTRETLIRGPHRLRKGIRLCKPRKTCTPSYGKQHR